MVLSFRARNVRQGCDPVPVKNLSDLGPTHGFVDRERWIQFLTPLHARIEVWPAGFHPSG